MMTISHDELTKHLIKKFDDAKIRTEEHYNYYGDRGVVDLVTVWDERINLIEVKTQLDQANKVIRQCNRMADYFCKSNQVCMQRTAHYFLGVLATPENYEHIKNNWELYKGSRVNVIFAHPDRDDNRLIPAAMFMEHEDDPCRDLWSKAYELMNIE